MELDETKPCVIFYRDDFKSDYVFNQYCGMLSAIVSDDRESVAFYVIIEGEIDGDKK